MEENFYVFLFSNFISSNVYIVCFNISLKLIIIFHTVCVLLFEFSAAIAQCFAYYTIFVIAVVFLLFRVNFVRETAKYLTLSFWNMIVYGGNCHAYNCWNKYTIQKSIYSHSCIFLLLFFDSIFFSCYSFLQFFFVVNITRSKETWRSRSNEWFQLFNAQTSSDICKKKNAFSLCFVVSFLRFWSIRFYILEL